MRVAKIVQTDHLRINLQSFNRPGELCVGKVKSKFMMGVDPNFFDLIVGYCIYISFASKQQQQSLPEAQQTHGLTP